MRIRKLLVIVFLVSYFKTSANQEMSLVSSYKNIKFSVQDINWDYAWLTCILINKLAESYNYNDTIYFVSKKIGKLQPQNVYYISYNNNPYSQDPLRIEVKKKSLVIGQINNDFNIEKILKLVEYSFKNKKSILRTQKNYTYNDIFYQWNITSIDTSLTRAITTKESSASIKKIISKKTFVPQFFMNNTSNYIYYFENNKYNVVHKEKPNKIILSQLNNVHHLQSFNVPNLAIVFDTDSTFYLINQSKVSKKFTLKINNNLGYLEYRKIEKSRNTIFFEFHYYSSELGFNKWFELSEIRKSITRTFKLNIDNLELLQNKDQVNIQW